MMGGHARIPNEVFELYGPEIGCIGIALYGLLQKYADARGECYPALATLCETLAITRPTALKYLAKLEERGLIERVKRRTGKGTQERNLYRIMPVRAAEAEPSQAGLRNRVKPVPPPSQAACSGRVNDSDSNKPHGEPAPMDKNSVPPERAGPAAPAPPLSRERRPPAETEHQRLMAAYQEALGYRIRNGAQEGNAAKHLLREGHTVEEIIACYRAKKSDPWYADKHLSLPEVRRHIDAWKQAGGRKSDEIYPHAPRGRSGTGYAPPGSGGTEAAARRRTRAEQQQREFQESLRRDFLRTRANPRPAG